MAFKIIETQEELNAIIDERLRREREAAEKKYEGYLSPEDFKKKSAETNKEIEALKKTIEEQKASAEEIKKAKEELENKVAKYETDSAKTRIALEMGLPYEIAGRLSGTTEEEIKSDAEAMAKLFTTNTPKQPLKDEGGSGKDFNSGYHSMLAGLTGKDE